MVKYYFCGGNTTIRRVLSIHSIIHTFVIKRKRNFCPLFLRYLINSYCNQMMMVRWNGSLFSKFDVTNGVKQGRVLSPLLFSVYLNDRQMVVQKH